MGKPLSERKHEAAIRHDRKLRNIQPDEIRRSKCQQSKARNEARKAQRRAEAEERQAYYRSLSDKEKLKRLDRLGLTAEKERAKIEGRMKAAAA